MPKEPHMEEIERIKWDECTSVIGRLEKKNVIGMGSPHDPLL